MSEESQVFRGDRAPERSQAIDDAAKHKSAAPQAPAPGAASAASFNDDPPPAEPAVEEAPPAVAAPAPVAAPEPELTFEVDRSQLWHAPEALRLRMAQLRSTAVETSHVLDEQEAEARRIEKQLKSL